MPRRLAAARILRAAGSGALKERVGTIIRFCPIQSAVKPAYSSHAIPDGFGGGRTAVSAKSQIGAHGAAPSTFLRQRKRKTASYLHSWRGYRRESSAFTFGYMSRQKAVRSSVT